MRLRVFILKAVDRSVSGDSSIAEIRIALAKS